MVGLRHLPLLLTCLAVVPLAGLHAAHADEIMNLSIPAPYQLGEGTALNNGGLGGIVWNSPRVETITITALAPLITAPAVAAPQPQLNTQLAAAPYTVPAQDNSLFGRHGVVSADTSAFTKWNDVVARERQELRGPHTPEVTAWLTFLASIRGESRENQLEAVNNYANRIAYISDADNYGQADHWATSSEFLARGGDCEDYAITKYMSLEMLGFDTSHMRVVVLFDQNKQERHAVLAVDDSDGVKILDNQSRRIVAALDIDHYQPIYAISQTSWWRYV